MKNIISIPLKKQKNTDFIGKYEGKPVKFCSEIIKQLTKKSNPILCFSRAPQKGFKRIILRKDSLGWWNWDISGVDVRSNCFNYFYSFTELIISELSQGKDKFVLYFKFK